MALSGTIAGPGETQAIKSIQGKNQGRLTALPAFEPLFGGALVLRRFPAYTLVERTARARPRTARKREKLGDNLKFIRAEVKTGFRGVKLLY